MIGSGMLAAIYGIGILPRIPDFVMAHWLEATSIVLGLVLSSLLHAAADSA
jgi:hypothetical protein